MMVIIQFPPASCSTVRLDYLCRNIYVDLIWNLPQLRNLIAKQIFLSSIIEQLG